MQETGDGQPLDLRKALERMERELLAQRAEMALLRQELSQLKDETGNRGDVLRPRRPAPLDAVTPITAEAPSPWVYPSGPVAPIPPLPSANARSADFPVEQQQVKPRLDPETSAAQTPPTIPAPAIFSQVGATDSKPEVRRSVENRIGSQVFNRIGIVALLVGVALALKFAVDRHWLHFSPSGRIASGLIVGAAVVLWSERFRRKGYGAFSYSLKAVGTGTLYLTLWASFQMYHLLPASVALIAMIAVTAWNAIMAWAQDSELLAAYALVGGFATPALLGSGGNHEVFLFSYVLAMDVAVLFLLIKKPWQRLLLGSFPGTVTYFIGWYTKFFTADQAGVTGLFAILLSLPFVAVALFGKQREDVAEGVLAPLGAATFLSLALYSVLQDSGHHAWLPWGAVVLAAAYLLLMRVRRAGLAEAVHLALAVVFLTIAIPLKAEGRWITIGWLAEGVSLIGVAAKLLGPEVQPRVRVLMRWLGCGALALGVVQSLIFWFGENAQSPFWNARFATEMAAVGSLALAAWLARHAENREDDNTHRPLNWPVIALSSMLGAHLIAALAGLREISAYWTSRAGAAVYRNQLEVIAVTAFLMAYGAILIAWVALRTKADKRSTERTSLRILGSLYLALGSLGMIVTPMVGDGPVNVIWNARLFCEMIGAAALAATAWIAWSVRKTGKQWSLTAAISLVTFNLLVVLTGVHEIVTYFGVSAAGDANLAEAFSISAWLMVYAAALLAAGFWKRMAFVRWQGMGLLVFTIGKVFLYDMHSLSSGYRILSVFGLGALLMVVSFAYQKDWLKLREAEADADEVSQ